MRCGLILILFYTALQLQAQQVLFNSSNLPIMSIQTLGSPIVDEPKVTANMQLIYNGPGKDNFITDVPNVYNGFIGIEFRGSSSQGFPKKPYGFELRDAAGEDREVTLLGMPKESDWTLNATFNDKSLMRDGLAYILAGDIMKYAPRVRYLELMLDGRYEGVYLLVEKIKRDKNRVDIAELDVDDNQGDALTGGYIMKFDKTTGSGTLRGWNSPYPPFPGAWQRSFIQFEYPDAEDLTDQQFNYMKNYMNFVENAIASPEFKEPEKGFRKYIDTESLIDFIIMNELTKNPDAYRISTFFYKERDSDGGKLVFGPVWDFNLGFGNVDYCTLGNPEGLVIEDFNRVCNADGWVVHFWWKKFLSDPQFYRDLKLRWKYLRSNQLSNDRVSRVVDSLNNLLAGPQDRNFKRWPILGQYVWPNWYVGSSHYAEVLFLKGWVRDRMTWLDNKWSLENAETEEGELPRKIAVSPNPATDIVKVKLPAVLTAAHSAYLMDLHGKMLDLLPKKTGTNTLELNLSQFPPGVYVIAIDNAGIQYTEKIVKL